MDQKQAPILEALARLERRPPHGFGAPGHHQNWLPDDSKRLLGARVFQADVLTPKGLDDRTESGHVLQRAHEIAAEAWHADFCRYVTGGSTQSLQVVLAALARPGDTVLLAANVHKAERSFALATGLRPVAVPVIGDDGWDVEHGVDPDVLAGLLDRHPEAKAFVVVSPTYYGVTSDIAALADVCHRRGVPLVCDAAWGGAFAFCEGLPPDALAKGADVAVYSLHKTMGALTQGSALLGKGDLVDRQRLWLAFEMIATTSPNIPILASLEATRREHALHGERLWTAALARAADLRARLAKIDGVRLLGPGDLPPGAELDATKITVDISAWGVSAYAVDDWLAANHNVVVGLAGARHLLAMVSLGTTAGDVRALARGLADCARQLRRGTLTLPAPGDLPPVSALGIEQVVDGSAAFAGPAEQVPIEEAAGRIAAELIAPVPPGVPRLVPGQRITEAHATWLAGHRDAGAFFLDPTDPSQRKVRVVAE